MEKSFGVKADNPWHRTPRHMLMRNSRKAHAVSLARQVPSLVWILLRGTLAKGINSLGSTHTGRFLLRRMKNTQQSTGKLRRHPEGSRSCFRRVHHGVGAGEHDAGALVVSDGEGGGGGEHDVAYVDGAAVGADGQFEDGEGASASEDVVDVAGPCGGGGGGAGYGRGVGRGQGASRSVLSSACRTRKASATTLATPAAGRRRGLASTRNTAAGWSRGEAGMRSTCRYGTTSPSASRRTLTTPPTASALTCTGITCSAATVQAPSTSQSQ